MSNIYAIVLTLLVMVVLFKIRLEWTTHVQWMAIEAIKTQQIDKLLRGEIAYIEHDCWDQLQHHHVIFWDITKWRYKAFYPDL